MFQLDGPKIYSLLNGLSTNAGFSRINLSAKIASSDWAKLGSLGMDVTGKNDIDVR